MQNLLFFVLALESFPERRMGMHLLLLFFVFVGLIEAQESRRLFEFGGTGAVNFYQKDDGSKYRYGASIVGLGTNATLGLTKDGKTYGAIGLGGMNEIVTVRNLPNEIVSAAKGFPNILDRASLRLQYSWGANGGYFINRYVKVGAAFDRNSWRHDHLGYGAGSTIPYIKGIQKSVTGHAVLSTDKSDARAMLDVGFGKASVNYLWGVESYLTDGDNQTITTLSGFTVPVAMGFGWAIKVDSGSEMRVIPFVRLDFCSTSLSGAMVNRRIISFGVALSSR